MAKEQKLDLKTQEASKETKQNVENNTDSAIKETKESTKEANAKDLESLLKSLSPQEAKVLRNFINYSVYDTFITYLENTMLEKGRLHIGLIAIALGLKRICQCEYMERYTR